jgi:hypothetical protein
MAANDSIARHGLVKDLTGQVFGRLTVVGYAGSRKGRARWLCECECGNMHTTVIRKSRKPSCGCLFVEAITTHGGSNSPEYRSWVHMIARCHNANNDAYATYGGRGITVCDRWRESFADFLSDMGPRPSIKYSLDRFPDQNGDYESGNVRWATALEQGRNRTNNRLLTLQGETHTLSEWSETTGIPESTLTGRLDRGWTLERALQVRNASSPLLTFKGRTQMRSEWAAELGIPLSVLSDRFRLGWSVERAFTQPVRQHAPLHLPDCSTSSTTPS